MFVQNLDESDQRRGLRHLVQTPFADLACDSGGAVPRATDMFLLQCSQLALQSGTSGTEKKVNLGEVWYTSPPAKIGQRSCR
jgi:hypothetical protein